MSSPITICTISVWERATVSRMKDLTTDKNQFDDPVYFKKGI